MESAGLPWQPTHSGLCSLPPDCLARVVQQLSLADVHSCLLASRLLNRLLKDERVWHSLCTDSWGSLTQLHRDLYYLLHRAAPIVGLWSLVGEGPVGALVAFSWTRDGILGEELQCNGLEEEVECTPYRSICPRRGLSVRVEVLDERHAVVKDGPGSSSRLTLRRTPSAEAAASVALSQASLPGGAEILGTSPQGSFEFEWLAFMASHVSSGRAKQRRRAAKSPAGPGSSPVPLVHHLKRVQQPLPTPKHPLAGLWAAECGGPSVEILRVHYDFSEACARVIATKVTGNRSVAAGQQAWVVPAAPLPRPWPPADLEAVEQFEARWAEEEEAHRGLREWLLDEEEEEEEASAAAGQQGLDRTRGSRAQEQQQVVAIHDGSMQVPGEPGAGAARWSQGRLWVLATGALGFLLEDELLSMRRIDDEVAAVLAGGR
ncbi:hypothetical protein N2152v2_007468 [Parachlorella kessleri]